MGQKNQLWWDIPASESFLLNKHIYSLSDNEYNETLNELVNYLGALAGSMQQSHPQHAYPVTQPQPSYNQYNPNQQGYQPTQAYSQIQPPPVQSLNLPQDRHSRGSLYSNGSASEVASNAVSSNRANLVPSSIVDSPISKQATVQPVGYQQPRLINDGIASDHGWGSLVTSTFSDKDNDTCVLNVATLDFYVKNEVEVVEWMKSKTSDLCGKHYVTEVQYKAYDLDIEKGIDKLLLKCANKISDQMNVIEAIRTVLDFTDDYSNKETRKLESIVIGWFNIALRYGSFVNTRSVDGFDPKLKAHTLLELLQDFDVDYNPTTSDVVHPGLYNKHGKLLKEYLKDVASSYVDGSDATNDQIDALLPMIDKASVGGVCPTKYYKLKHDEDERYLDIERELAKLAVIAYPKVVIVTNLDSDIFKSDSTSILSYTQPKDDLQYFLLKLHVDRSPKILVKLDSGYVVKGFNVTCLNNPGEVVYS